MKSAIHQYISFTSDLIPKLMNIFDNQKTYEETIKPEQDVQLIIENYGTGKFWPSPMLYVPYGSRYTDYQIFGVPLTEQLSVSKKPEPMFIAKSLSAITKMSVGFPKDEAYNFWKAPFDLAKVHDIRYKLNTSPKITLKFFKQQDLGLVINTLYLYLLELPDCLCTSDLYDPIKALYSIKDDIADRLKPLSSLLSSLYPANLVTLKAIVKTIKNLMSDDEDENRKNEFLAYVSHRLGNVVLRPSLNSNRSTHDLHPQKFFTDLVLNYEKYLENLESTAKVTQATIPYYPELAKPSANTRDFSLEQNSIESFLTPKNIMSEIRSTFSLTESTDKSNRDSFSSTSSSEGDFISSLKSGIGFFSGKFKIKNKENSNKQAPSKSSNIHSSVNTFHEQHQPNPVQSSPAIIEDKTISNDAPSQELKLAKPIENEEQTNNDIPKEKSKNSTDSGHFSESENIIASDTLVTKVSAIDLDPEIQNEVENALKGSDKGSVHGVDDSEDHNLNQTSHFSNSLRVFVYPPFDRFKLLSDSFDPECQALVAYLRFTDSEWEIRQAKTADIAPLGELPFFSDGLDFWESGLPHCIKYLKLQKYDLDSTLSDKELAISAALQSAIRSDLRDALSYEWFIVEENYYGNIKPNLVQIFGRFPAIFNISKIWFKLIKKLENRGWIVPKNSTSPVASKKSSVAFEKKDASGKNNSSEAAKKQERNKAYESAEQILKMLDIQLGNKPFFMGDNPTTLDAIAFGYLSLAINVELKKPALKSLIVLEFPKLLDYVSRLNMMFYGSTPGQTTQQVNRFDPSLNSKAKSKPLSISLPGPDSFVSFAKASFDFLSPSLFAFVSDFKAKALQFKTNLTKEKPSGVYNPQLNRKNTPFGTSQFLIGSLFLVLGFVSSKRIFITNEENILEDASDDEETYSFNARDILGSISSNNEIGSDASFEDPSDLNEHSSTEFMEEFDDFH
ncbi:hypothetical protein BB560_004992 [Smittium megazygosporum]|uniref:Rho-GAP domain-containing protein n=1 Tax=Smittium megazygosporum TaxID=133381 RepID=A0A2T9Z7R1_9FUNG|nr:hypothetical protein BB560_004992 [Smittium megazygosporum]